MASMTPDKKKPRFIPAKKVLSKFRLPEHAPESWQTEKLDALRTAIMRFDVLIDEVRMTNKHLEELIALLSELAGKEDNHA